MTATVNEQPYFCPLCHTRTTKHGAGTVSDPYVIAEHEAAPGIPCNWSGIVLVAV